METFVKNSLQILKSMQKIKFSIEEINQYLFGDKFL